VNQFQLVASISEREALRFTPAGIPIVTAKLMHDSMEVEAGIARQVQFEITALGAGEIAGRFNAAELGREFKFVGFIARKGRNSKGLVFHVRDFEPITPDH
jgi:primosomal replication protein N